MAYGVTPEGFNKKTREIIQASLEARWRKTFGASMRVDASSRNGQYIGIMSDEFADLWDLAQAVDSAQDPDQSEGVQLDQLAGVTGTLRLGATKSTVTAKLTGNNATAIAAGKQIRVGATGVKFLTTEAVVLADAVLMALYTPAVGDLRYRNGQTGTTSGSPNRLYVCVYASGSLMDTMPPASGPAFYQDGNDNEWALVGEGSAWADSKAECTELGPFAAPSNTLTTIDSPVSGWFSVINFLDAALGNSEENEVELRARREDEARSAEGSPSTNGIREAVGKVAGVTYCQVFENVYDGYSADGIPPHSIEVLVEGGVDQAIREAIFDANTGGIRTHGSTTGTVLDSGGFLQDIRFTRPTVVSIYVTLNLTKDVTAYPIDGDNAIKTAVSVKGDARPLGWNVTASQCSADGFYAVAGIIEVTSCFIGLAPGPATSTPLTITARQRADFDTSRTVVNATAATP